MSGADLPRYAKLTFERRMVMAEVASDEISPEVEAFLRQSARAALIVMEAMALAEFPPAWPLPEVQFTPRPSPPTLFSIRSFPKVVW